VLKTDIYIVKHENGLFYVSEFKDIVLFLIFILLAFTESGDVNWYWFSGAILSIIISGCGAILIIKGKLKIIG